jgi:AcrR family transcriptional regulator
LTTRCRDDIHFERSLGRLDQPPLGAPAITNFDRRLAGILAAAARVFAAQGYDRAAIREVAEAAGVSVPGLYHYVRSKEEILYLIQLQAFESLVQRFTTGSRQLAEPESRLELLIRNHLERFLANLAELTVCAREIDRLKGEYQARIEATRREYFALAVRVFVDLGQKHGTLNVDPRTAALAVFGSINWVSTWYRPGAGPSPAALASAFLRLYLDGVLPRWAGASRPASSRGVMGGLDV